MKNTRDLLDLMARLRDKQNGCPWDIEQNYASIAPHTIEEAYEVAEAIAGGDMDELRDELGDLLLQVVFHAQMAKEEGAFDFEDVAASINEKLIRRHPHIFGDAKVEDAEAQVKAWEAVKAEERRKKSDGKASALDGVPAALPALTRAEKLTRRAASVGFDWPSIDEVFDKLTEEIGELKEAVHHAEGKGRYAEELGDMLFVCANLARHLKVDPEEALRGANRKFTRRFHFIEHELEKQHRSTKETSLQELDVLWDTAKLAEK